MEDNFVDNRSTFSNGALLSVLRNAFARHECYNEQLSKLEWRTWGRIAQAEKNSLFGDGLLHGNFPCAARLARMHLLKTHPLAEKTCGTTGTTALEEECSDCAVRFGSRSQ